LAVSGQNGSRQTHALVLFRHDDLVATLNRYEGEHTHSVAQQSPTRRFAIVDGGWVASALRIPSPNRDARPAGVPVTLAVVHGISLPPGKFSGDGIIELFTNRLDATAHPYYATIAALRVSAHFLVRRRGELLQFVSCADRAWHAGKSSWRGRERCNDFSIGIELEGADDARYTAAQYRRLARLLRDLRRHHPIADVVGHSDIAPGRKTDPGPCFDWPRLARLLAGDRG
jgi:AmpD protein